MAHPGAVASAFALLAGNADAGLIVEMLAGPIALAWLAGMFGAVLAGDPIIDLAATALVFVALPPLAAFAVYFAGLHGPRAITEIARVRGCSARDVFKIAAPFVALAIGLIALGYAVTSMALAPSPALVRALFIGLAALAVPHLALGWIAAPAFAPGPLRAKVAA